MKVLADVSRNMGKTVIIITHNSLLAPIADRLIEMKNGALIKEHLEKSPLELEGIPW
ncbi:hypothetical protein [Desulfitobacterium hafniense]|uniref:hypothetical protein n=1 Tax=Desulfitobacterium hafniense TaxID=49338 RepID=UPI000045A9E2|nr:hypothetical protein [Desulfitobacterium hafniense]